jgi:hypothetical protein
LLLTYKLCLSCSLKLEGRLDHITTFFRMISFNCLHHY